MRANFVMSGVAEGMRRNLLMSIALVLTTAVSLSFVAAAILTGIEIHRFSDAYKGKLNVEIYLCDANKTPPCTQAITPADQAALEQRLHSDSQITQVSYISAQQAYEDGLKSLDPAQAQFLQVGTLPPSFSIKLKNIDRDYPAVATRYSSAPGVQELQNQDASLKTILQLFNSGLLLSVIVAIVVLICAVILIAITIQVAAAQRRTETNIMRLVGASRWVTQLPFMLEAIIAATLGGLVSLVAAWFGKWYVLDRIFHDQVERNVLPNLMLNDVLIAGGISLIAGIVLAAVTAYVTLRLYVRV